MAVPFYSLEQLDAMYNIEQDWHFEKLRLKLNAQRHLILSADLLSHLEFFEPGFTGRFHPDEIDSRGEI